MPDLLKDEKYLDAVAKSCERLDRILSGSDTLSVKIHKGVGPQGAPAYQRAGELFLCPEEIRSMVSDPTDEEEVIATLVALLLPLHP